ncbi:MAG: argininosuccinate synthase [Candidatus Hermodarchaeia archaeon]|jgi:argininosuccinate synthase
MRDKLVLAYSGGLDTSTSIKWIQEKYNVDVVTLTINVGQGDDIDKIEKNAKTIGALKHFTIDARREFVEEYIFKAIKANALYEGKYPLSSALSRPLIATKLVEVAKEENAIGVAHGCTGKGNDQVRFDVTIKSLAPELKIIAPMREWNLTRPKELKYLQEHDILLPFEVNKKYSIDRNLWGRSIEGDIIEQPNHEPPEDAFLWTISPEKAPDTPEYISIGFTKGIPSKLNGQNCNPVQLINDLNRKAGRNGVGRIDQLEDRLVGIKSREVYECPAAVTILEAHSDLEKAVLTRHELAFKRSVEERWSFLVYAGLWLEPLRTDLDAFIDETQQNVTGEVRLKLYKGGLHIVGRSSPMSLYNSSLATYGENTTFDQTWSEGFIELWGLPTLAANIVRKKNRSKQ